MAELREYARLQPRAPAVTGVTAYSGGGWTREHELLDDASELRELGRFDLALVAMQRKQPPGPLGSGRLRPVRGRR
jgi:hypothetical protein